MTSAQALTTLIFMGALFFFVIVWACCVINNAFNKMETWKDKDSFDSIHSNSDSKEDTRLHPDDKKF